MNSIRAVETIDYSLTNLLCFHTNNNMKEITIFLNNR